MTTVNGRPPMLDRCDVLPPMEPVEPTRTTDEQSKPNRKTNHRKTGRRFAVLNAFVDATAGELSRSELLVWLVLYRDTRDGVVVTSQADVARRTKLANRTVRYAIHRLVSRGLLTLIYRGGLNRGPSKYRVLADLNGGPLRQ